MVATPALLKTLIIGDDPKLLAQLSCLLAQRGRYLPILEGPRLGRPDGQDEVVRRNNAAARLAPSKIVLAGLKDIASSAFEECFPSKKTIRISAVEELIEKGMRERILTQPVLQWGSDRIGIGLLQALRQKRQIEFGESRCLAQSAPSESGDLVVCEEGNELAKVIAANYAFAIGAGLTVIPKLPKEGREHILECFYGAYDHHEQSPTEILTRLSAELRSLSGGLETHGLQSITFITNEVPWGFAYPEIPSTHLFAYPDLGIAVLNGLLAEQQDTAGIRVALLIDPGEVQAAEMEAAIANLRERGVFISGAKRISSKRLSSKPDDRTVPLRSTFDIDPLRRCLGLEMDVRIRR